VALSVELAPLQIADGDAAWPVGTAGVAFTVTVTLAQVELTQPVVVLFVRA